MGLCFEAKDTPPSLVGYVPFCDQVSPSQVSTFMKECYGQWRSESLKRSWSPVTALEVRFLAPLNPFNSACLGGGGIDWQRSALCACLFSFLYRCLQSFSCFATKSPFLSLVLAIVFVCRISQIKLEILWEKFWLRSILQILWQ